MAEAREGCATLDDIDERTFVRFAEFLYIGDYHPAEPNSVDTEGSAQGSLMPSDLAMEDRAEEALPISDNLSVQPLSTENDFFDQPFTSKRYKKAPPPRPYKTEQTWLAFQHLSFAAPQTTTARRIDWSCDEGLSEVLISHAQLYALAERYDIQSLRVLSLQRLHKDLTDFEVRPSNAGDIIALLRYVYENTPERINETDALRELVSHYIVCKLESVATNETFKRVIKGQPSAATDIFARVITRFD